MPAPEQTGHSTEPPKARHQDLRPVALPLLLLLRCMQTEPRAALESRDPPGFCYLLVGRRLAEEAPGKLLVLYHPAPPLLQPMPSLPDNSTLDTTPPLLDTRPWSED